MICTSELANSNAQIFFFDLVEKRDVVINAGLTQCGVLDKLLLRQSKFYEVDPPWLRK